MFLTCTDLSSQDVSPKVTRPYPELPPNTTAITDRYYCHLVDGPKDQTLKCDASSHQIISVSNQESKQKRNLIIFDVDHTILESKAGYHDVLKISNTKRKCMFEAGKDLELLLLGPPYTGKCSMVFRRHFFELLKYIHRDEGLNADLAMYTRARPNYARQVELGIDDFYRANYDNSTTEYLFKLVIAASTPTTAKTIKTLAHKLNLPQYENIIILDDGGNDCWCRYEMVKLKAYCKVNVVMMQCDSFSIWDSIHKRNRFCTSEKSFYSVLKKERDKDKQLVSFHEYLELLHQNKSTQNVTYFCVNKSTWKLW